MITETKDNMKTPSSERGFSFLTAERIIAVLVLIILCISLYAIYTSIDGVKKDTKYNTLELELVKKKNDSLTERNLVIEEKLSTFDTNINNIDIRLSKNTSQLEKFKAEINEKVNAVDNTTRDERRAFIAREYPQ